MTDPEPPTPLVEIWRRIIVGEDKAWAVFAA